MKADKERKKALEAYKELIDVLSNSQFDLLKEYLDLYKKYREALWQEK